MFFSKQKIYKKNFNFLISQLRKNLMKLIIINIKSIVLNIYLYIF